MRERHRMSFRHGIGPDKYENAFALDMLQLHEFASLVNEGSPHLLIRVANALSNGFVDQRAQGRTEFIRACLRSLERSIRHRVKGRKQDIASARRQRNNPGRTRIAVLISGGLGDILQRVPFIIRFEELFSPEAVDLFLPARKLGDIARIATSAMPFIRKVVNAQLLYKEATLAEYDLVIEIRHMLKYHVLNRWLLTDESPLRQTLATAAQRCAPFEILFDQVPRFDGMFGRLMASKGMNVAESCGYLGAVEVSRYDPVPLKIDAGTQAGLRERFDFFSRPYITLHEGFDIDTQLKYGMVRATRCWPLAHWSDLVRRLKEARPDLPIVQIGTKRSTVPVPGVDHMLLDQVSLLEATAIIAGGCLHLDSETGMVSVAWGHRRPTISIQGPTASDYYQIGRTHSYYWKACHGCWRIREDWMSRCVRELDEPECMHSIEPAFIAGEALRLLEAPHLSAQLVAE